MEEYLDIFKALSDKTRLRTICLLIKAKGELCLCEVVDSLNETHYNVSRHFKILKRAGLVKERREGRWVFYSLTEPQKLFQEHILKAVSTIRKKLLQDDYKRLKLRLTLRKDGKCVVGMDSGEWGKKISLFINKDKD